MRLGRLGGETDERVLLAAALAVRALRGGSVCLELATVQQATAVEDVDRPRSSPPWPGPMRKPGRGAVGAARWWLSASTATRRDQLRLVGRTLYLDRYWRQEQRIAEVLDEATPRDPPAVDAEPAASRRSAETVRSGDSDVRPCSGWRRRSPRTVGQRARRRAGHRQDHHGGKAARGPAGPGRTPLRVALAAPTGKAAARLTEAVAGTLPSPSTRPTGTGSATWTASTLHRLLGWRPGARDPLPPRPRATGCPTTWSSSTRRRWCR